MNFEYLPNEILLDLFEYFSVSHLFRAFFDLNTRFNQLLCVQFQQFHLDLRLLSKTQFDQISQNYVPLILDRIISLHLSNDDDTPQEIELFLSQYFQLRQFTRLQSISLSFLRSLQTLDQIMLECSYLSCLTHLTFTNCNISISLYDTERLFNYIWSLTNLTYCNFDICFAYENYFPHPIVISTSLKHLIIRHTSFSLTPLTRLCQHTPNLAYLSINFDDHSGQLEVTLPILSLTRLDIHLNGTTDILEHLLQNLPNLSDLTCRTADIDVNGDEWEKLICQYLPKLKLFQFQVNFRPFNSEDIELKVNKILDTYRTKFWIAEHQWFVRCHLYKYDDDYPYYRIHFFTLPYIFDPWSDPNAHCILAKSTCPYDDKYLTCNDVTNLYMYAYSISFMASYVRFNNIQYLSVELPFDDQFLSVVLKLDRLTFLDVWIYDDENFDHVQSQLQILLDRASHLRSLRFNKWLSFISKVPTMEMSSISIRRLDFPRYGNEYNWFSLDDEQCIQLCHSPLVKQCETLSIEVQNRRNILDLMNNIPNLQMLNVGCYNPNQSDGIDELVEWLHHHLPSSCEITISASFYFQLWIR